MNRTISNQGHERLQKLMLHTFKNEVQTLNPELQSILIDDLVTAFHNRLAVFKRIQTKH